MTSITERASDVQPRLRCATRTHRVQRLILRGCHDMFHVSEMIEERTNFRRAQFTGMLPVACPVTMEFQEPPRPQPIRFLGAQGIVFDPENFAQLVEQFGLGVGDDERSLCRARLRRHNRRIGLQNRAKGNQNPAAPLPTKAAFSLPNTC